MGPQGCHLQTAPRSRSSIGWIRWSIDCSGPGLAAWKRFLKVVSSGFGHHPHAGLLEPFYLTGPYHAEKLHGQGVLFHSIARKSGATVGNLHQQTLQEVAMVLSAKQFRIDRMVSGMELSQYVAPPSERSQWQGFSLPGQTSGPRHYAIALPFRGC